MRVLYLDCAMGAAGDMLAAALYELLDDAGKKSFLERMNRLDYPDLKVTAEKATKCGIVGTGLRVTFAGLEENADFHGDHGHAEHSVHLHSGLTEISQMINSLPIEERVKEHAQAVYRLLAEAEGQVHGRPVDQIHFHEVGTMDAIADITAVCLLMEMLEIDRVIASKVHVGSGQVRCAHGILPVPAPAAAYLLREIPIYSGGIKGELCTPTGAALLKYFVNDFGNMPAMRIEKIGYGMGKKDFPVANCIRALLGQLEDIPNQSDHRFNSFSTIHTKSGDMQDQVFELSCNLDDMTPERIGFAVERLFELGALDVYTIPIGMKKCRLATMLCVLCTEEKKAQIVRAVFKHTTTLGIRENICHRYLLDRKTDSIKTDFGAVRVKHSEGYGVTMKKYEYDDLARIAAEKNLSLDELVELIEEKI